MLTANIRSWTRWILAGLLAIGSLGLLCNLWITLSTQAGIYHDPQQVPPTQYALVLGTSPQIMNGDKNPFFNSRIEAVAQLYKQGKVQYLVLSGAHDRQYYNEPLAMQRALTKLGIPQEAMLLDIEGKNTLASIKRAREVWGIRQMIIITQKIYAHRALYISQYCGLQTVVFAAQGTPPALTRAWFRELLARIKALIDLHLLQKHQTHN